MDTLQFAAERARRLQAADAEIEPFVITSLGEWNGKNTAAWDDVVTASSVLWLEIYEREGGDADFIDEHLASFQTMLRESLAKTTVEPGPPMRPQIDRVTMWLGTVTVNDATYRALGSRGARTMRWVTMHDDAVREMHRAVDGQIRGTRGTFNVGGHRLHYPGEPVGPPEVWINCRCLVASGTVRRSMSMATPETLSIREDLEGELERDDADLPDDPDEETDIEGELLVDDAMEEVPWHAVLAPEGIPTGDGRMFARGALGVRNLPLPITYQYESAEGHLKAVVVGRMDEAWRDEATNEFRGRGVFWMNEPMAHKAIDGIAGGFLRGLSVDVDDIEVEQNDLSQLPEDATAAEIADAVFDQPDITVFSKARISGASIVHIPAFPEAYIALGPDFEEDVELTDEEMAALTACGCIDGVEQSDDFLEAATLAMMRPLPEAIAASAEFAPGTKDGPGWITHPRATARIRRYWVSGKGALKIKWGAPGDFNRCRLQLGKYVQNPEWLAGLCANMHREALGIWPAQHRGKLAITASAGEPAPMFNLVAAGGTVLPADAFSNPGLTEPTGIVIDGDRIYGYIATWGVCHIGIPGKCEMAPKSPTNYAYFRTGVVETDAGEVSVGSITMGTGHAGLSSSPRVAMAHYDNTGAVIADIAVGEDLIGIWFSGMLRPNVTDEARHALAAAGRLSGDWRDPMRSGQLELIAALAVNVPGFPIPQPALVASAGEVRAVTSMGMVSAEPVSESFSVLDAPTIAAIARTAVEEYREQEAQAAAHAVRVGEANEIRKTLRSRTITRLRSQIEK